MSLRKRKRPAVGRCEVGRGRRLSHTLPGRALWDRYVAPVHRVRGVRGNGARVWLCRHGREHGGAAAELRTAVLKLARATLGRADVPSSCRAFMDDGSFMVTMDAAARGTSGTETG